MNNNINSLTFEHHDTYIWHVDELLKSTQHVILTPTNSEDRYTDRYTSREAKLFTNGVNIGIIKFNGFLRSKILNSNNPINKSIVTIITNDGILIFNFASERNSSGISLGDTQIKILAIYKSDKYSNYINVEIQVDFFDTYRTLTISY